MKFITLLTIFCISFCAQAQKTVLTPQNILNLKRFSPSDLTDDGHWIVGTVTTLKDRFGVDHFRFGDPSYISRTTRQLQLINSKTGEVFTIEPEGSVVGWATFSNNGKKLAYYKAENDKWNLYIYSIDRNKSKKIKLKDDRLISHSKIVWGEDDNSVILGLRSKGWLSKGLEMYNEATSGPITVYDASEPFLKWEKIRNHSSLTQIVHLDLRTGNTKDLLPEGFYHDIRLTEEGDRMTYVTYTPKKTDYKRKNGRDFGLYAVSPGSPEKPDTLIAPSPKRINTYWNELNNSYAYVDSSHIYINKIAENSPVKVSMDTTEIYKNDTIDAEFSFLKWRPDGSAVLAASKTGYWMIDLESQQMEKVYQITDNSEEEPERRVLFWSVDEDALYMTYSAKDEWERGIVKYDLTTQEFTNLMVDDNLYDNWDVSKDGERFFYHYSDGDNPANYYTVDKSFRSPQQLTDLNPWISQKKITRSELIKYRDADGNELKGVLYYPVDYEEGKKYPLVCELYETFFDNGFHPRMNLITAAGFFGFRPSVTLEKGYPGEAWIKAVPSGVNKLIEMGLVDEKKVGVHGISYGGYATSLLISQTDRFAAAINISGKTNIISFLGDSPKIGTRNYSAAEVGQDRIGETLWEAPLKYINTSAVMFADRINTPHLMLTGEGDWNVSALNTRELYYALRRLGKEAVWVNYQLAGHGAGFNGREEDFYDQCERIVGWYTEYFEKADEEK